MGDSTPCEELTGETASLCRSQGPGRGEGTPSTSAHRAVSPCPWSLQVARLPHSQALPKAEEVYQETLPSSKPG